MGTKQKACLSLSTMNLTRHCLCKNPLKKWLKTQRDLILHLALTKNTDHVFILVI